MAQTVTLLKLALEMISYLNPLYFSEFKKTTSKRGWNSLKNMAINYYSMVAVQHKVVLNFVFLKIRFGLS